MLELQKTYANKKEARSAIALYNKSVQKCGRVVRSCPKRIYFECKTPNCSFACHFSISSIEVKQIFFAEHNCSVLVEDSQAAIHKPDLLTNLPGLKEWFLKAGMLANLQNFVGFLASKNIYPSKKIAAKAFLNLKASYFVPSMEQFCYLPSYVEQLRLQGHKAELIAEEGRFKQLNIAYSAGLKAFSHFKR